VALAPGVGEADVDAAPVLLAHRALDEPVVLEARDDAAQRALREVHLAGDLLDAPPLPRRRGQPVEDLELADPQAVLGLERVLERAGHSGVAVKEIAPFPGEVPRGRHDAHHTERLHLLQLHFM